MKTIIAIVLSIFLSISLRADAQFTRAELQASGLTCSMCSNAINKALKKLLFVERVDTDLNNNRFLISFKTGAQPDFDQIRKKVEDAGFSVATLLVFVMIDKQTLTKDAHLRIGSSPIHFLNASGNTLEGEKGLRIVDKGFVSSKEYRRFASLTAMKCYETGFMESCCKLEGGKDRRIYHVII